MENTDISLHKIMLDEIIEYFYNIKKPVPFKKENVSIEKVTSGLTNFLYVISFTNEEKFFVKIFGAISQLNLVDRKFENKLISVNSISGLCPSIIKTDDKTYRIEEYLKQVHKPTDESLFNKNFLIRVIDVITQFELSFIKIEKNILENSMNEITIFSFPRKCQIYVKSTKRYFLHFSAIITFKHIINLS